MYRSYLTILRGKPAAMRGKAVLRTGKSAKYNYSFKSMHQMQEELFATPYMVQQTLAGGMASLVGWKLSNSQVSLIQSSAHEIGCPILGDEKHGGGVEELETALKASASVV